MTPFSKWTTIGYAAAIFLTGGISGGALGVYETRAHLFSPVHEEEMVLRLRRRLENRLDLTPGQVAKINPIITSTVHDIRSIRMESTQRVIRVLDASYSRISAVLTPEQRVKLNQIQERERAEMMQRMQSPHRHEYPGSQGGGVSGPGSPGGFGRPPHDGIPAGSPTKDGTSI
ncbi:MAG TPA: hypothetical protein VHY22_18040 [Chthoniobacteraceae bacterium]|jgi:hypothetical protein|nr:hypothetical protein [Chthoniobacteraceae bacterium]